jgi:LuxR family transcriptional regulator, maltose regulon positive regulatory protein
MIYRCGRIVVFQVGTFTARKSMLKTKGHVWKAYHRRNGKLYRIHLGHSHSLILQRLQAAAHAFARGGIPEERVKTSSAQFDASKIPIPRAIIIVDNYLPLIQTKLYKPRNRSDLIPRARLIERLDAGLNGKVTLVCAPAGFGKTTLLAERLHTSKRPSSWFSLDANDIDLSTFVHSLTAALQTSIPMRFRP